MYVIAFDPGSNYTGWAVTRLDGAYVTSGFDADVQDCIGRIESHLDVPVETTVLIEGYQSGGYLTKEAKNTIGIVRTLKEVAEYWGFEVVVRPPQARLSSVSLANSMKPEGQKDEIAALAHALSYTRTHGN